MEDLADMTYSVPTDSLGRRVGLLRNFSRCSDKFLLDIKTSLGLEMSISELSLCRSSYANARKNDISLSTLYLFDEIAKGAKQLSQNQTITDVFFGDKDMLDTYNDLFEKHCLLCGEDISPLSLTSAASVASKYMSMIGLRSQLGNTEASFLEENTAFSIILPTDDISFEEYEALVKKLIFEQDISEKILRLKSIDSRGIAVALSDMAVGIYADIYSIPCMPEHPELSHLATECHSRYIIATKKEDIAQISELAEELGLTVSYFAKAISTPTFSLLQREHISFSADMALLRELGGSTVPQSFELGANHRQSFLDAVNSTIDSLLPALAESADLQDIILHTDYTFSADADKAPLGASLASILGVYRVICELCIPNSCRVRYSHKDELSLGVTSEQKDGLPKLPSCFSRSFSGVYLLSFDHTENTLPDFESLRGMCSFIKELCASGAIISAKAVNGSVSEALDAMQTAHRIILEKSAYDTLSSSTRGIIVESSIPLKTGILLGSIY